MITVAPACVVNASSTMRLPARNGVLPSTFHLPSGEWNSVLECLCACFASVPRETWLSRFLRGLVLDADGNALNPEHRYQLHLRVHYYREVSTEATIPFAETVLHEDEHLLVSDKPHFLPAVPSGTYVNETLLARLIRRTGNPDLVPLHRIDRATAGLVMFSVNAATRGLYQQLFRDRKIAKVYEAVAAALPHLMLPVTYASRIVSSEPFFRMQQVAGTPNCETVIDVIERGKTYWRYELRPITGRKHQLRVQMAALGAAILNDTLYPNLRDQEPEDQSRPLQLLAKQLRFVDPLDGRERCFASTRQLLPLSDPRQR